MNKAIPENAQAGTAVTIMDELPAYTAGMQVLDARGDSRFHLLARAMRTLVDLLHTEHGYARIFYDQDGYSYELDSYRHAPIADLFTRMLGYASASEAAEAARQTLSSIHSAPHGRSSKGRARGGRKSQPESTQLLLPVGTA